MDAVSYESITVGAAAVGLTPALLHGPLLPLQIFISVETAGIRFRIDGIDPTAAEGHLLQDEDSITLSGRPDLSRFRAIRSGGVSATIRVTYFA